MKITKLVKENIDEHNRLFSNFNEEFFLDIANIGKIISNGIKNGSTIFWCGNGGSASDALHINAELVGRFKNSRKPLKSISLNADIAAITCISNDFGFEEIFSRQIEALAVENDILIGISTSGKSKNIIKAFKMSHKMKLISIALLGKDGGDVISLCQNSLLVHSQTTARIQECHIMIGHIICDIIESELGLN